MMTRTIATTRTRALLPWLYFACLTFAGCWGAGPQPNPPAGSYSAQNFEVQAREAAEHINLKGVVVKGARVSDEFFASGKILPLLGRTFLPEEHRSMRVVVISNQLWNNVFHTDPAVIGRTLQVNGENVTIVGIMPKDFSFPGGAQLWVPLKAN